MLALIAGQGRLPVLLAEQLDTTAQDFAVFQLIGFPADNPLGRQINSFRIEELGSFIQGLVANGVTAICFAGSIRRPAVDPSRIDALTRPLVGRIETAILSGDDGALQIIMSLFEEQGLQIKAAQDIMPDLLPPAGVLTRAQPTDQHAQDIAIGQGVLARQGAKDLGQACVIYSGRILAQEGEAGTDAMLGGLDRKTGGILFKGPKPQQDRRADMPTIGIGTVAAVVRASLDGIVVQADGVLVVDLPQVIAACDDAGIFLWLWTAD